MMKPTGTVKPKVRRRGGLWKRAAALPRRIWAVGGAAVLVLLVAWCASSPDRGEAPQTPSSFPAAANGGLPNQASPTSAALPETGIPEGGPAFISAVRLRPSQPTRMDSVQAEVVLAPAAPGKLVLTYRWRVNDRTVPETAGSTLALSPFAKGDLITVTVTPSDGGSAGLPVESPPVAVHGLPPSLELKALRQVRKPGEPVELQLTGTAPEGGPVAFSLAPPLVPGMTIDRRSGKISWALQPDQKGAFRFGAAVEDDHGTKVTRTFEVAAE